MNFQIIREKVSKPFNILIPIVESILAERVSRDCPIFISHKSTMTYLIKLEMVNFDVILGVDWL